MLEVTRSIVIDRPVDDVAAQFADIAHHERTGVHRDVTFHVVAEAENWCDYDQRSRVGPGTVRQRCHLDRHDRRHQVNTITRGMFRGGTLYFEIASNGLGASHVTATVTAPTSLLTRLLAPVLRPQLGRSLATALDEDKADLESGHYPSAQRTEG